MDLITGAILGGLIWDFVKYAAEPTIENVRTTVGKVVNIDETIEAALSKELASLEVKNCESLEELTTLLDSSPQIQSILAQINQSARAGVVIQNFGEGDAFYGDKVMGNKIITK
ncbi:hypothetical protein [Photobacterium sanguinicancri]|uniref:hypothetical protein n=1 Tax=Photobacterium sanguinicancri TaxID=875932 RepID=UPI000788BF16|nr:hypothetical protein [Photobacterium sanguinicancri]KXI21092.1 hypothetical protein AS132_20665 [Photobacterium sanguinicancri]